MSMLLLLNSLDAGAVQMLEGDPDETLHAVVSREDPTLVRVEGTRIRRVYGAEGDFTVIADQDAGAAYLKPTTDKSTISVFVSDEANRTWKLLLSVNDKPSDSIVIKSRSPQKVSLAGMDMERNRVIKHMLLALDSDQEIMETRAVNRVIPLWHDAMFVLTKLVEGPYKGEKYRLTNVSNQQMVVDERELYRQGVVAISVERPVLNPAETSDVYVILERNDE